MRTDSVMDVSELFESEVELDEVGVDVNDFFGRSMQGQWDEVRKANDFFERAMQGQWDEVVEVYRKIPLLQTARMPKSEDTALHIAVSYGLNAVVFKLVESLGENASNILRIKNDEGNTPLHLAAALGHKAICNYIASKDPLLIADRNKEGETPLFLAALEGKKEAFLCLNHLGKAEDIYGRNHKGDTVLHAAISGEDFSLAFHIIQYYSDLVHSVNEMGVTPLHILASKPNAFQSSFRLWPLDHIIYYCVSVDKLKKEKYDHKAYLKDSKSNTDCNYPQNYETCMTFFQLMKRFIRVFTKPQDEANDEENPEQKSGLSEGETITGASSSEMKLEIKDQTKESSESKKRFNNGKTLSKKEVGDQKTGVDQLYPPNFTTFVLFLKLILKALLIIILGIGKWRINKITKQKERHTWANQIMNELVDRASLCKYKNDGCNYIHHRAESQKMMTASDQPFGKGETALLIAAKMGVAEMVEKILDKFPEAVYDLNWEHKNVVLLAVENRQTHIYQLLLNRKTIGDSAFKQQDKRGNNALHLAARFGKHYRPWLIPGAVLQMQWEIKCYEFVEKSKPPHFFDQYNYQRETAKDIFTNTHKGLVKEGKKWLTKTSESCSMIAIFIATVAFASIATVPGGVNQGSGKPTLEHAIPFNIFAISSLVAVCFSVTALVFFLAIITFGYQDDDFSIKLPTMLLLGFTSLFTSIASTLISFCSAHFFILAKWLRPAAYPFYVVTCLPMTLLALAQLPLLSYLFWAIFKKVPQLSYKVNSH